MQIQVVLGRRVHEGEAAHEHGVDGVVGAAVGKQRHVPPAAPGGVGDEGNVGDVCSAVEGRVLGSAVESFGAHWGGRGGGLGRVKEETEKEGEVRKSGREGGDER